MKMTNNPFVFLTLILLSPLVLAAPGDLDTTFGGGAGWVSTGFGNVTSDDYGRSVIQQADGKLVVAGQSGASAMPKDDFILLRYNTDGSLDNSFGVEGLVKTFISTSFDDARSVIQQADGKLVAAGSALVRYNADGSLDAGFGADGIVSPVAVASTMSVIQQSNGKLVTAGASNGDFALSRYNVDGTLDTSFSGDGVVTTAIGTDNDFSQSVIQQSDGKLVAAGYAIIGNNMDFALVRYNTNGSRDTAFNVTGKVTTAIGVGSDDRAYSVIQQTDGKLVVAGYSGQNGGIYSFALARYNTDGTLDTTFNGTGIVTIALTSGNFNGCSVVQQVDGKLVVAGHDNFDVVMVRYNGDGSLDTTLNGTGKVTTSVGPLGDRGQSLVQQLDGKLVIAGYSSSGNNDNDIVVLRYNTDGLLDTTFNSSGVVKTALGSSWDFGQSVIQQSDGSLVMAGYGSTGGIGDNYTFGLFRYHADATLDESLGGDGGVTTDLGNNNDYGQSVIQQMDGKLVLAGYSWNGINDYDFSLARYNADGALDTTFSEDGKLITTIGGDDDTARSVIQQADAKLVLAGSSYNGSNMDFALVRYNTDGTLDPSFSGDGKTTIAIGSGEDSARSVIQQADGKLVVAGSSHNGSNMDFSLVRYNLDGTLDSTFNGTGVVVTAIAANDQAYSVIQQADGKLVVAGYSNGDFSLVRYNLDGTLDTSFSNDGKLTTAVGTSFDYGQSVIQQSDGKLVVAGYSVVGSANDFALVRYNTDGTLDTSFGSNGKIITAIGVGEDTARSIIQQFDGKLVVAGYAQYMPTGMEFVVARYESGQLDTDNDGLIDWLDTDNDADGMPNDWEQAYGLNPLVDDASDDLDSDGFTNLQEYQNSTDPTVSDLAASTPYDFDADGDSDMLLRNPSTGQNVVWLLESGAKLSANTLTTNATTFEVAAILDGDNDGDADILWYDSAQGKLIFWQMENGLKQANAFLGNTTATLDGVGDFDGDGDPDILLKTSTGSVKIWTLNNLAIVLSTTIGTPASGYQVIDTGDFNGDGIDDIVMQNTSGAVRIWQLNSSAQLDSTINVATINTAYFLKKSGDTDNDGDDDLIFRNDTTGQSIVWEMENSARVQANTISGLNPSMSLATVTDFDKDGDEDLMFRDVTAGDSSDGDTIIWKMQDNVKQSNSFLGNNAVTFLLESTLDMDGDGDFDILYRDNTTGQILGWNMESGAKAGNYNLGNPGLSWEPRF